MKLSGASLVSILVAGLANAQGSASQFSVTGFSAGATPHSSVGHAGLSVSLDGKGETKCSASPQTYQKFPNVPKTPCADPATSFSLTRTADSGADLEIWREISPGVFAHGKRTIPESDIVLGNQKPNPNGAIESYVGPGSFTFPVEK
ncbi:uncharacterized protein GGS22DRAFT_170807 [Annulohypoxylon maeteangense]|uniref:uncharacterized protein n=1 Tax=Annulohypoxylon maeteangense TaxID=1927788 RepID=UPI0020078F76|nr:uncharacterized protein GGS22DRAFT_170807 [Annulohypoxylon maeteangense]KAI0882382.1 hypothetical protein GGS22DRAFT_170807 [Annulohypoxylon maeteangense]